MNFPDHLFPDAWQWFGWLLAAAVLAAAAATAPWRRLGDGVRLNVWLGTVVALALLWSMKAGVYPGLNLHLLGASAFVLMFGLRLGFLGLALVLAAVTLNGDGGWQAYGLNLLVTAAFPALLAAGLLRLAERFLPHNYFVYVFANAFFGAALGVVAVGVLATLLLTGAGVYAFDFLSSQYLPYFLLLGFAEAWLTGGLVAIMVIYLPRWVGSFDDARYLFHK